MENLFKKYREVINITEIQDNLIDVAKKAEKNITKDFTTNLLKFIDLTFLNITDNANKIGKITRKVNHITPVFGIPNVACIMVYPRFVPTVKNNLTDENVKIGAVVGNFPSSQTFIDIKIHETQKVINAGANEVDMVISVGEFLDQQYQLVFDEIKKIKEAAGSNTLKVIIESGTLQKPDLIYKASILAMEAGADFIKTSTGKEKIGATPEAIYIMSLAIKDFYEKNNKKVGIKPAGGVSSIEKAALYYTIVENILGSEWLNPDKFRIGSSSLANKVLTELNLTEENFFTADTKY